MAADRIELPALPGATVLVVLAWNLFCLLTLQSIGILGLWVFIPLAVVLALTGLQIAAGRRRLMRPFAAYASPTGAVILPPPPWTTASAGGGPGSAGVWVGAALVPTALGGMRASTPLAQLVVGRGDLVVRIRPAILSLMFGYQPAELTPQEVEVVVPVVGRFDRGVAIRPHGRPATYFVADDVWRILHELETAGFPVDWHEFKVRRWRRAR